MTIKFIIFIAILSTSQILAVPFKRSSTVRSEFANEEKAGYQNKIPPGRHGCREARGFSLCAGEALKVMDSEPWCPVRMCAPKYVPAEVCPVDALLKATAHCELKAFTRDYYKCDGQKFGTAYIPEGCDPKKDEDCEGVKSCSCVKVKNEEIKELGDPIEYEGYCNY